MYIFTICILFRNKEEPITHIGPECLLGSNNFSYSLNFPLTEPVSVQETDSLMINDTISMSIQSSTSLIIGGNTSSDQTSNDNIQKQSDIDNLSSKIFENTQTIENGIENLDINSCSIENQNYTFIYENDQCESSINDSLVESEYDDNDSN